MIKEIAIAFSGLFLWGACTSEKEIESPPFKANVPVYAIENSHPELEIKNGIALFRELTFSGQILSFYEDGTLHRKESYYNGKLQDSSLTYYPNGQLYQARFYHENKRAGIHKAWYPNGQLKFWYTFHNGLNHGNHKEWSSKGTLLKDFNYKMGFESGSQKLWDINGKIKANFVTKNGKRYGLIGLKLCQSPKNKTNDI